MQIVPADPALLFRAVVVLIYAFMFLPIAIVVLVSLNAEPYLTLPPEFTLQTMNEFIDWDRDGLYVLERGEGECAI